MPLNIEHRRNGRALKGGPSGKGWSSTELNACYTVCVGEAWPDLRWNDEYTVGEMLAKGLIGEFAMMGLPYLIDGDKVPLNRGSQKIEADHTLRGGDDVTCRFKKGDIIRAWRS